jgi:hypothetical protein
MVVHPTSNNIMALGESNRFHDGDKFQMHCKNYSYTEFTDVTIKYNFQSKTAERTEGIKYYEVGNHYAILKQWISNEMQRQGTVTSHDAPETFPLDKSTYSLKEIRGLKKGQIKVLLAKMALRTDENVAALRKRIDRYYREKGNLAARAQKKKAAIPKRKLATISAASSKPDPVASTAAIDGIKVGSGGKKAKVNTTAQTPAPAISSGGGSRRGRRRNRKGAEPDVLC